MLDWTRIWTRGDEQLEMDGSWHFTSALHGVSVRLALNCWADMAEQMTNIMSVADSNWHVVCMWTMSHSSVNPTWFKSERQKVELLLHMTMLWVS